ncbi:hypothetical protein [Vibrio echinoideorum]|uniref:hypothetical protein n=1 Tax=Vibrio echinoideorum TaxID=2100116 RepID=UPI00355204F9
MDSAELKLKLKNTIYPIDEINRICSISRSFVKSNCHIGFKISTLNSYDDFVELSEFRKLVYKDKNEALLLSYGSGYFIDDLDLKSVVFGFYYLGSLIGVQRVSKCQFEILDFIDYSHLNQFLGYNFENEYVEYSRLAVKKTKGINSRFVAHSLAMASSLSIMLTMRIIKSITYTKSRLKRKNIEFSKDELTFTIPERGDDEYILFKADMLKAMCKEMDVEFTDEKSTYLYISNLINNMSL